MGPISSKAKVGDDIQNSPLKCLLKNWKQIREDPLSKPRLIQYCNQRWRVYQLNYQAKRPENGTLVDNILLWLR